MEYWYNFGYFRGFAFDGSFFAAFRSLNRCKAILHNLFTGQPNSRVAFGFHRLVYYFKLFINYRTKDRGDPILYK
jgi:hypothetical protein